jgi:hypothetical protein
MAYVVSNKLCLYYGMLFTALQRMKKRSEKWKTNRYLLVALRNMLRA